MSEKKARLDPEEKSSRVRPEITIVFHSSVIPFFHAGYLSDGEYDGVEFGEVDPVPKIALDIANREVLGAETDLVFDMKKKDEDSNDLVYTVTHGNRKGPTHANAMHLCRHTEECIKAMFRKETKEFAKRPPHYAVNMCVAFGEFSAIPNPEEIVATTIYTDLGDWLGRCTKKKGVSFCVRRLTGGKGINTVIRYG